MARIKSETKIRLDDVSTTTACTAFFKRGLRHLHLVDEVADEAHEMTAFEGFVHEQVLDGRSTVRLYPVMYDTTLSDFEA